MRAWLFTGRHEPLRLIERETPRPGPGEAVLEVRGAGLCHTDVGILDGTITSHLPQPPPLVLGHEVAGVVAEVGPGVTSCSRGDRVVVSMKSYTPGWMGDGGYATHCVAPAASLLPLAASVSFAQGAIATDAGNTSYVAVMRTGGLQPGQRVGIVGLGGLGMTGARIAVLNGAQVYAADPRREVWETAKAQGVTEIFEDVLELSRFAPDLIVDFAGYGTTTAGAIQAVGPGGVIVQVGVGRAEATISTADLVGKAVTLRGSRGDLFDDTAAVLRHMAKGELAIPATTIGFEEIPEGLERLARGEVVGRLVAEPN